MGFWARLLGSKPSAPPSWEQRPAWLVDGMTVTLLDGSETLEVVGESNYQDALWTIVGGRRPGYVRQVVEVAVLVPEKGNPHDPRAVSVWIAGLRVGYIGREQVVEFRLCLERLMSEHKQPVGLAGTIVGGLDEDHAAGMLGVFLDYDSSMFTTNHPLAHRAQRGFRTGLSVAVDTDAADDSYDLAWLDSLPADRTQRVERLRSLLGSEVEPISRHYVHELLVDELYRIRDKSAGGLTSFDEAALAHDQDLVALRPALVSKFGGMPMIDTYRCAAIRQAKAGDFALAQWWSDRGLAMYGREALRPDAVEDLQVRAARYWQRQHPERESLSAVPGAGLEAAALYPVATETLTCQTCGKHFDRVRVRGRKPLHCPDCR